MRSHISHMHHAVCHVGERIVMGSHTAHKHMKRHVVMGSRISYMWETGVLLWGLISHTCCYGVSYLIHVGDRRVVTGSHISHMLLRGLISHTCCYGVSYLTHVVMGFHISYMHHAVCQCQ